MSRNSFYFPGVSPGAFASMSQSELSRKLSDNPDDPRRFTVGDLEAFIKATGNMTPIYYLVERFLEDDSLKQQRAMAELLNIVPHLAALIKQASKA